MKAPIVCAAVAVLAGTSAIADPIDIHFIHPDGTPAKTGKHDAGAIGAGPTESFSGWQLGLELTMKGELGIASQGLGEPPVFPIAGETGFIVFSDPDECLVLDWRPDEPDSWPIPSGPSCYDDNSELVVTESDEQYFEFTLDHDALGVPDSDGNPRRIAALVDATSGRPLINPAGGFPAAIGPMTSEFQMLGDSDYQEIVDGYGYGADDDVPGLVIFARHGPGIVYGDDGTAATPLQLRNLAGFTNFVSYELNNKENKTTIQVQMLMPGYLVAPVVIADDVVSGPPGAPTVWWRVDGALTPVPADEVLGEAVGSTFEFGYPRLVGHTSYVVSAMAVSGVAPDVMVDLNQDNQIDRHDLELMGYTVLGRKKSVSFRQFPAQACHGGSGLNTVYADLDGNGRAFGTLNCPAGAGSISKPPR